MKVNRSLSLLFAGFFCLLSCLTPSPGAAGAPTPTLPPQLGPVAPAKYIVILRDMVPDVLAAVRTQIGPYGVTPTQTFDVASEDLTLKGYVAYLPPFLVPILAVSLQVAAIIPDVRVSLDSFVQRKPGETSPPGMARIGAATATTVQAASDVAVAVIDTGIQLDHPDLNVVNGVNCIDSSKPANDDNGHGTHVAGIIGARNNGAGIAGVAPGTKLYAVKVLDSTGSGELSNVICGLAWVAGRAGLLGIKVANLSFGGEGTDDGKCGKNNDDPKHTAICILTALGVTVVVSAGNRTADLAAQSPAAYSEVLTVTAVADSDGLPGGLGAAPGCWTTEVDDRYFVRSNYAVTARNQQHTIAAPGVCVTSTWLNGGYATLSGTSMATPHVAGAVALCLSNGGKKGPCAGLAPARIITKIRADATSHMTPGNGFTGDPLHPIPGRYYGPLVWAGGY